MLIHRSAASLVRKIPQILAGVFVVLLVGADTSLARNRESIVPGFRVHRWQVTGPGIGFNGTDQYLDWGNHPILHMSAHDFTVEVRVTFDSLTSPDPDCTGSSCGDMSLVDKMSSDPIVNGDGWRLFKHSDNRFWFCLGNDFDGCSPGSATAVQSTTVAETGMPYHVAARKTDGTLSIYVNGVAEATILLAPFTDTNQSNLLIGRNGTEGAFLSGTIDTVGLYPKALKGRQIRNLYRLAQRRHPSP